jgi:hypothetical protein
MHVVQPELPALAIELVALEAVYSRRSVVLHWCTLTDLSQWLQGWRLSGADPGTIEQVRPGKFCVASFMSPTRIRAMNAACLIAAVT